MALDRRFGFAGAAAVLMLVQVQVLALDQRFGFAGAAAVMMLVQLQVLALDRHFVLRHARDDIMSCQGMSGPE